MLDPAPVKRRPIHQMLAFDSTPLEVRLQCRSGAFRGVTTGLCGPNVQANLVVLPSRYADDFRGLCRRNPVSCPLIGECRAAGDWRLPVALSGEDSDVRRDAPGYHVYKDGTLVLQDIPNITAQWENDSIAFLIGCSFTFESPLIAAGLIPRHIKLGRNVPMYKTTHPLLPSGIFRGTMVVSMRPYKLADIERVREITRPFVATHGEPVSWGHDAPRELGIIDLMRPEFGDPPDPLQHDEVPIFWGCGVTPQVVITASPDVKGVVMAHAPGKMLCLDLKIEDMLYGWDR